MRPFPRRTLLLALLAASSFACRAAPEAVPKQSYVMVFLVTGPNAASRTPEEQQKVFAGHMENIRRLADEGKLLIAGPFGQPKPDERLRGIFILDTPDVETARAWTNTDPGVEAGVFAVELAPFRSACALHRSLELYRAETAELEKSGGKTALGERVRGYTMVLAREADRAELALSDLRSQGKVAFEGNLDGSERGSYLAVLDADNPENAAKMIGGASIILREYDIAVWWSTKAVAGIPRTAR